MFSADTRGNDEDKERRNPSTIFVPVENSEPTEGHEEGDRRDDHNPNGPADVGDTSKGLAT